MATSNNISSPRLLRFALAFLWFTTCSWAGGPRYVAGASYFDPAVKGLPLAWPQGMVDYYTDQGDLSQILPQDSANALVADTFSRWTSIPTAALVATRSGQLDEDVNGSNVTSDALGNITLPADIQPTATHKPVAVVYDADGAVTDALLGAGAGSSSVCFTNAVFGGVDNFSSSGYLAHALIIINGNCAQNSADVLEVRYRLVRVVGRVLGLDWSQLNLNVDTGNPRPTAADYAGFPLMHEIDSIACVPITLCYPNPDLPKVDDIAALSRLYPVTAANQANFPGKLLFAETTGRVHGTLAFTGVNGLPIQPMQGVNVVARWIDPLSGKPSRQYAATSVSGFLFRGNAGNLVTGFTDSQGQQHDRFGSDDVGLEGFFDLAGLQFPDGQNTAQYEIAVEALDPGWSRHVGPYSPWPVKPSGGVVPIVLTVVRGSGLQQDIAMQGSAGETQDLREPESFAQPTPVPSAGDWIGSLSGYGDPDFYWFAGRQQRTMSVEVTALDESGAPTQDKARPVVGIWPLDAPAGATAGAATPTAFNTLHYGVTRLDAILLASTNFRIGVVDERGDGRPDFRYHARVLYGGELIPSRATASGGSALGIEGIGFRPGMNVSVGSAAASVLWTTSTQLIITTPPLPDGLHSITVSDPRSGASTSLIDALVSGADAQDSILLLAGSNPPVLVGGETPNPIRVRVLAADGITSRAGASVYFSIAPTAALSACRGAAACTVFTDEHGEASTRVTPAAAGTFVLTATLAPASYNPAKFVQTTVSAMSSSLDLALLSPRRWIAQDANLDVPLTVRVLSNGSPLSGRTVNYRIMLGNGTLTSSSAVSDSNGHASTTLQLRNFAAETDISACVAPDNAPCSTFYLLKVVPADIQLEAVAGSAQMVVEGQPFRPVIVGATDSASPPNPVEGALVTFDLIICRPDFDAFREPSETLGGDFPMPVMLGSDQVTIASDAAGLASLVPSPGGISGAVEIEITVTAGLSATQQFEVESVWNEATGSADSAAHKPAAGAQHPVNPGVTGQVISPRRDLGIDFK